MSRGRALVVSVALIAGAVAACVIAEPPADLPTVPAHPPIIERGSVVPPPTAVLVTWPEKFVVPVELDDPRSHIEYSTFVDYNAATGTGLDYFYTSDFDLSAPQQGSTRILDPSISEPSADGCHVVEIVVALKLSGTGNAQAAHTPLEPGGDSVSWFYSPTGDLAGCPALDAGLLPDAQALESIDGGGT